MVLIRKIEEIEQNDLYKLHGEVEATYVVFERDGKKLLQLNTHGSPTRKLVGKRSQNMQFDQHGAEELYQILRKTFGFS
ncbi:methionyl-tRNA formyltransferase [Devosia sp. FJ2-5-3]|jgi:hypothetical protein|uniref:methionyl-tRNA formyltransferase n=1 Tax=Devosia sp. FJ2-5-3 TaxID=2976680 RepID=UPI0023D876AD|nr:methionyl-tRNA formyltransferase [Devosia sp. FJ2-5-3]WEJ57867.1 methionyl-tRNA formyltransferase [Devosia sp. FJ2-5-3]